MFKPAPTQHSVDCLAMQEPHMVFWMPVHEAFSQINQEPTLNPTAVQALLAANASMTDCATASQILPHLRALASMLSEQLKVEGWLRMNFPIATVAAAMLYCSRYNVML